MREHKPATYAHLGVLVCICLLFAALSTAGITWGLPSRDVDKYLFGAGEPWSGEKIYRLAKAEDKFDKARGADVDPDPIAKDTDEPILLTGSNEDTAKIYLRYRLYTYQPDEMITMMSLAGMRPGSLDFDPRLYQYGGLFIYPVGVLIKLCDLLGLIDVRSDVVYYLDNPEEFGKFYIVARAYSAAWGLLGVIIVFAIARRLAAGQGGTLREPGATAKPRRAGAAVPHSRDGAVGGPGATAKRSAAVPHGPGGTVRLGGDAPNDTPLQRSRAAEATAQASSRVGGGRPAATTVADQVSYDGNNAGLLAALLFTLMPVVVCMTHEAKPHLPGAVLMLAAVLFAVRYLDSRADGSTARDWWLMCICCGAAFGMVLSSWPIFMLIPLVAWLAYRRPSTEADAAGATCFTPTLLGRLKQTALGTLVGIAVYIAANPYVLINALFHPEILESNLGNSFAMYDAARIGEGFLRVLQLTAEGATHPILVGGALALVVAIFKRRTPALPLVVTAGIFFVQFVCIGAGKPGEYGRFGIFPNTALAIGAACVLTAPHKHIRATRWALGILVIAWCSVGGNHYLANFRADTTSDASRLRARRALPSAPQAGTELDPWTALHGDIGLIAEPAPYCCPPLPFDTLRIHLFRDREAALSAQRRDPARWLFFWTVDKTNLTPQRPSMSAKPSPPAIAPEDKRDIAAATPISWANKPIEVHGPVGPFAP